MSKFRKIRIQNCGTRIDLVKMQCNEYDLAAKQFSAGLRMRKAN